MRKLSRQIALILFPLLLGGVSCKGTSNHSSGTLYRHCHCGTPEHDVLGCTTECRATVRWYCGNPDCTCQTHAASGVPPAKEVIR